MSQLHPELRRLVRWARAAEAITTDPEPQGFGNRVSARWRAERLEAEPWWWGHLKWATIWTSVLLVSVGIGIWASERPEPALADKVFPAYQNAARSLAP
jgi:hypothetical protein